MKTTKKQKRQYTTYREATKTLKLILCNRAQNFKLSDYSYRFEDYINEEIIKEIESEKYETEEEKEEALKEKVFDNFCFNEVKQYYLTDADLFDVKSLTKKYGLEFAYCDELGLYILLVPFYEVNWDDIEVKVKELKEY